MDNCIDAQRAEYKAAQKAAQKAMSKAIHTGKLVRPELCELCGGKNTKRRLAGHHHKGYAPEHALDVIWLCNMCHARVHGGGVMWKKHNKLQQQRIHRQKMLRRQNALGGPIDVDDDVCDDDWDEEYDEYDG